MYLSEKICAYTWVSENLGHSLPNQKKGPFITFFKKGGGIYHIPGEAEFEKDATHIRTI